MWKFDQEKFKQDIVGNIIGGFIGALFFWILTAPRTAWNGWIARQIISYALIACTLYWFRKTFIQLKQHFACKKLSTIISIAWRSVVAVAIVIFLVYLALTRPFEFCSEYSGNCN